MAHPIDVRHLAKKVARKYDLDEDEVFNAWRAQFKCVQYVMNKGLGESIIIPNFGSFSIPTYLRKWFIKYKIDNAGPPDGNRWNKFIKGSFKFDPEKD